MGNEQAAHLKDSQYNALVATCSIEITLYLATLFFLLYMTKNFLMKSIYMHEARLKWIYIFSFLVCVFQCLQKVQRTSLRVFCFQTRATRPTRPTYAAARTATKSLNLHRIPTLHIGVTDITNIARAA